MTSNDLSPQLTPQIEDHPECFLILLFWITMAAFGLWLYVHEPKDLPILGCTLAFGIYLLSSALIVKSAFQKSASWGLATAFVPAMIYIYAFSKMDSLKNETIVNLVSLAVVGISAAKLIT